MFGPPAPDQNCASKFDHMLDDPAGRCRFIGNVTFGRDVSLAMLLDLYDAVVLAYGAEGDRRMDVPGEQLAGVHSARAFVGWYNGSPDFSDTDIDVSQENAVVVGQGNVALDVARILLSPVDRLRHTDISRRALDVLSTSRIRQVTVVGRRGPVEAAFTIKEFRELLNLEGSSVNVAEASDVLRLLDERRSTWSKERARKRLLELVEKTVRSSLLANAKPSENDTAWRGCQFRFLLSPVEMLPNARDASRVASARFQRNILEPNGRVSPAQTGCVDLPAGLVVRSIGYRVTPHAEVPFNASTGTVPHIAGRVLATTTGPEGTAAYWPRLYAAGWVKTGPVGVIASTLETAHQTADCILEDWAHGVAEAGRSARPGWAGLRQHLESTNVRFVGREGWRAIDRVERERGSAQGAERDKILSVREMLDIAHNTAPLAASSS